MKRQPGKAYEVPLVKLGPWHTEAACDNDAVRALQWFPPSSKPGHSIGTAWAEPAKRVCQECPVRVECLMHAMVHHEHGVWGATIDDERRTMRRTSEWMYGPGITAHHRRWYVAEKEARRVMDLRLGWDT